MSSTDLWQIAVAAPLPQLLTYSSSIPLQPGQTVRVPLGKRSAQGVVIARETSPRQDLKIKSISESLEAFPILSSQHVDWALWIAKYYHYPAGEVFSFFFPPLPQKSAKAKNKEFFTEDLQEKQIHLNKEQADIVSLIEKIDGFSSHLLWGITGSGKTEVYIELIKKKLAQNQSAMILVPEIALTPQLVSRFRSRLGDQVAVLHSGLTDRERTNQWWDLIEKKKRVLIGARSALFCPMPDLGLIVVDEEHESSYKQDEKLRYNARDSAIVRAQMEKIPVLLGSATPSLE
ncbi:DEAD/DEAH box helicase family protein, partial [bacterium]|nr:DEAD/DEAH box helicase family protein [bacterium]